MSPLYESSKKVEGLWVVKGGDVERELEGGVVLGKCCVVVW